MKQLGIITAAFLACAGCVPFTAYIAPKVDGEVVDSTTNAAVPAATIVVHPGFQPRYDGSATTVTSDINGHFLSPEVTRRIWLPPLPFDLAYPDALISVSATGYEQTQQNLYELWKAQPGAQHVVIRLVHQ
jgi:hypothetical protein